MPTLISTQDLKSEISDKLVLNRLSAFDLFSLKHILFILLCFFKRLYFSNLLNMISYFLKKIKKFIDEYSNDTENLYNMYSAVTYIFAHGVKVYKTMLCGEFVAEILNNTSSVKLNKPF